MLTRRSAIKRAAGSVAALTLTKPGSAQKTDAAWLGARKKVAQRKRPLILDDDGDMVFADAALKGPEAFLRLRMHDCRAAGIDSVAWCMMWGIAVKGKTPTRYWQTQMQGVPFQENMPDPTPVVAKYGRENDIEVFGAIRMNDSHDGFGLPFPKLVYPLKAAHPNLLLGDESQRGRPSNGLKAAMWSGLNFAHQQVRDDRLWWIENTATKYNLDGVDLNFFRMPWYFKLGMEEQNMPLMTDLIRRARKRLDDIGRRRGRPVLLGVRVPGTVEACNRIGLDIETWLREGLVDRMLTGGGYVCYSTPAEELVQLGHRFEVPVYPCINCPATYKLGGDSLRAAASNLWWAGADGLYLWNFHYISAPGALGYGRPSPVEYAKQLPEIADPRRLRYLDKSFAVNSRVWEQYQRASAPAPLPRVVGSRAGDAAAAISVRIGDDIPSAHRNEKLRDVTLRLKAAGAAKDDMLAIKFNGAAIQATVSAVDGRVEIPLPPTAVKQGVNMLNLAIAHRGAGAVGKIIVERVAIDVRYRVV